MGCADARPSLHRHTWLCVRGGRSRAFLSSISFRSPVGTVAWLFLAIPLSIPLEGSQVRSGGEAREGSSLFPLWATLHPAVPKTVVFSCMPAWGNRHPAPSSTPSHGMWSWEDSRGTSSSPCPYLTRSFPVPFRVRPSQGSLCWVMETRCPACILLPSFPSHSHPTLWVKIANSPFPGWCVPVMCSSAFWEHLPARPLQPPACTRWL